MTMRRYQRQFASYQARHFLWQIDRGSPKVAVLTLDRPEKKNPLTFDAYAELRELFRGLQYAEDIKAIVLTGAGGNFSSGGDVREIIGPLTRMTMPELLDFTRMTGDLVKAMRACPQPIVAAVEGICAGAGAMMALASDLRFGSADARTAFLFTRVGLAGADMGACTLLPRMIGQGRASELLYTGRIMTADEGLAWGFFNALAPSSARVQPVDAAATATADTTAPLARQVVIPFASGSGVGNGRLPTEPTAASAATLISFAGPASSSSFASPHTSAALQPSGTSRASADTESLIHAEEPPGTALSLALECARRLADGPTFAHGITKKLLHQEWAMGLDEAIEHEAQAQAICMQTKDFRRAYKAFMAKEKPEFKGN